MNKLISIIIPVYNAELYLYRCLDSILKQKYKNYEVILINDGSKDNSLSICEEYVGLYKNFTVINQLNKGVSFSRNIGIMNAKGDFICFIDADDEIKENYLSDFINEYQKSNADITCCDFDAINMYQEINIAKLFDSKQYITKCEFEKIYKLFLQGTTGISNVWNKLFKSSIIKDNNLFFSEEISNSEDMEFVLKYLNVCNTFSYIQKSNYIYHYNDTSLTKTFNYNQLDNHLLWKHILYENIDETILKKYIYDLNRLSILEMKSFICNSIISNTKISFSDLKKYPNLIQNIDHYYTYDFFSIEEKMFIISLKFRTTFLFKLFYIFKLFIRRRVKHG